MAKIPNFAVPAGLVRTWMLGLLALASLAFPTAGITQSLTQGNYYWYAPEHEKYAPTVFYGEPRFESRQVRVKSTQRFKLLASRKGWYLIEFDIAGKAYIHERLLRSIMYSPGGALEFQRASVFEEEPSKIEARMQTVRTNPQASETDSKVPSWKRYKDSWGLNQGRSSTPLPSATGDTTADAASSPVPSRQKPKSKHSLLPPIGGSEQKPQNPQNPEPEAAPAPDGTNVPMPSLP